MPTDTNPKPLSDDVDAAPHDVAHLARRRAEQEREAAANVLSREARLAHEALARAHENRARMADRIAGRKS